MSPLTLVRPWWQHNGFTRVRRTDIFWRRVRKARKPGVCWPWLGGRSGTGYGVLWWQGKVVYAHRLAYQLYFDRAIPEHLVVRHRCDNPLCCRPSHLHLGTRYDNSRDMAERGRARSNVLSPAQVLEIRALHEQRTPIGELCARFNVTQRTIWLVVAHKTHRSLEAA
jgi:hypothetical protein